VATPASVLVLTVLGLTITLLVDGGARWGVGGQCGQRVVGKPRSSMLEPGSGHLDVITLGRV